MLFNFKIKLSMQNIRIKSLLAALVLPALLTLNVGCSSKADGKETTFKVYGNCEMCEKTIEGSLKDNGGVNSADWNKDTKMITVSYDPAKTQENEIHKQIAASGYDTELEKGNDQAYEGLHECCKYNRKK